MSARRRHRLPPVLRLWVAGLLALGMLLQPVMTAMGELHELAHDPSGQHAHVEHAAGTAPDKGADPDDSRTLHLLLHFAHCCSQPASVLPAISLPDLESPAQAPLSRPLHLALRTRHLAPFRPPIA